MRIRKECVDSIIERSERDPLDLLHIITSFTPEPRKEGASYKTACPLCGAEHSLIITTAKPNTFCPSHNMVFILKYEATTQKNRITSRPLSKVQALVFWIHSMIW